MDTKYFGEKSEQVDVNLMNAFGISIVSRYGKATEIIEMLLFCRRAAARNVHTYVESVFYDSKASLCSIQLEDGIGNQPGIKMLIFDVAKESISQFAWGEGVEHGDVTL